jgi:hypothetical protein
LTILVLTPEVCLPLRRASAEFHASTDGTAALDAVFALLDGHVDHRWADREDRREPRASTGAWPTRAGHPRIPRLLVPFIDSALADPHFFDTISSRY